MITDGVYISAPKARGWTVTGTTRYRAVFLHLDQIIEQSRPQTVDMQLSILAAAILDYCARKAIVITITSGAVGTPT